MIEPGFAGGLPLLMMADSAVRYADGTPLAYDVQNVDETEHLGYRLSNSDRNYFVAHFVVPPWMPASVKVRAILRVRHELSAVIKTMTVCGWGGLEEVDDAQDATTSPDLTLSGAHYNPTNVAAGGLTLTGLSSGDIVTCEFHEWVEGGAFSEDAWFVGFEVYE